MAENLPLLPDIPQVMQGDQVRASFSTSVGTRAKGPTPDQEGTSNTIPCQLLGLKHFMIASISSVSRVKGPFKKNDPKTTKTTKQAQDSPMFDGQKSSYFLVISELGLQPQVLMTIEHSMLKSVWYEEFLCINMHRSFSTNSPPKKWTLKRNPSKLKQIQSHKKYIMFNPPARGLRLQTAGLAVIFFF